MIYFLALQASIQTMENELGLVINTLIANHSDTAFEKKLTRFHSISLKASAMQIWVLELVNVDLSPLQHVYPPV